MNRFNQGISVIISAYEAQDFIEECLDSIVKQTFDHRQIEVILGIDGCKKTLKKVKEIKNKYHTISLKVLWFPENSGVYITTNTLISIAKHENILTFGADDIMNPEMISTLMICSDRYNMIKFRMLNFDNNDRSKCKVYHNYAEGCRFFSKKVFMLVGGYMPWRHTGDSELLARLKPILIEGTLEQVLFKRRLHEKALTVAPETCLGSEERNIFKAKIYENLKNNVIRIPMVTNDKYKVMFDLKEYWDKRYRTGGNSGAGSYGKEAIFKADYINKVISTKGIQSIQEYGCGDGANMALYKGYLSYRGYDIAPTSIELCKANPTIDHKRCRFSSDLKAVDGNADLALCLDVLFHQVEDKDYFSLLNLIFASGNHQFIILYTTIHVGDKVSAHLKQRLVADDIQRLYPQWKLLDKLQYNNTEKKYFLLYGY